MKRSNSKYSWHNLNLIKRTRDKLSELGNVNIPCSASEAENLTIKIFERHKKVYEENLSPAKRELLRNFVFECFLVYGKVWMTNKKLLWTYARLVENMMKK